MTAPSPYGLQTNIRKNLSFVADGAIAMAILAQPIAVIWGFPFGVWLAAPLIRQPRRAAAVLGLFVIVAAAIFIILAFLGPFGALMAAMPKEVAGAVLMAFA